MYQYLWENIIEYIVQESIALNLYGEPDYSHFWDGGDLNYKTEILKGLSVIKK